MEVQGQFSDAKTDVCEEMAKIDIKHDVEQGYDSDNEGYSFNNKNNNFII